MSQLVFWIIVFAVIGGVYMLLLAYSLVKIADDNEEGWSDGKDTDDYL